MLKKNAVSIVLAALTVTSFFAIFYNPRDQSALATFITGLLAIFAATIAYHSAEKQIKENSKIRKVQLLQASIEETRHYCSVAKAISADIKALTTRLEDIRLNEFSVIHAELERRKINKIKSDACRIEEDYHVVFHSLIKDITFFPANIVADVFYWYTSAKGYIETIIMINDRIKVGEFNPIEDAQLISNETTRLLVMAESIFLGLSNVVKMQEERFEKLNIQLSQFLD